VRGTFLLVVAPWRRAAMLLLVLRAVVPCLPEERMRTLIAYCTCPDAATAEAIARVLVERRLAACVTLQPAVSLYRWNEAVERADEVQLQIKTTAARFADLQAAIVAAHPYELPELIAVEVAAGLERYLHWIGESTSPRPAS
jgi:periplasmic divalent cation tolerance protein